MGTHKIKERNIKDNSKERPVNSVDKSFKLFGKKSGIFSQKFTLSSGAPLILFGEESDKERFVILKLKDFFKLTNKLIKNGNKK